MLSQTELSTGEITVDDSLLRGFVYTLGGFFPKVFIFFILSVGTN